MDWQASDSACKSIFYVRALKNSTSTQSSTSQTVVVHPAIGWEVRKHGSAVTASCKIPLQNIRPLKRWTSDWLCVANLYVKICPCLTFNQRLSPYALLSWWGRQHWFLRSDVKFFSCSHLWNTCTRALSPCVLCYRYKRFWPSPCHLPKNALNNLLQATTWNTLTTKSSSESFYMMFDCKVSALILFWTHDNEILVGPKQPLCIHNTVLHTQWQKKPNLILHAAVVFRLKTLDPHG